MNERGEFQLVEGRGNVFRDFEDPDADLKQAKAVLAGRVIAALDERGLGVRKAAGLTGFAAADFSRIRNANLGRFTLDRLLRMLAALDGRAEITLQVREPRPRRPIIVDKSYAQGAASLQVLHKDWDLVFPDAFFFEVTSTSAQARSRCLRKLRDIHRHGALHVAPNVGELLRREILGLNHAGAPSDNLIHGLPLDDFFGLSFEDLAQARRSALQQTEVQFSRDVDGLVAKANMLLGRFRGTSEGTTQERKKAYGIARNTIARNRDFISAFFADFVCQGRHLEPAAPILAAIARSNGFGPAWTIYRWVQVQLLYGLEIAERHGRLDPEALTPGQRGRFQNEAIDMEYLILGVLQGALASHDNRMRRMFHLLRPQGILVPSRSES